MAFPSHFKSQQDQELIRLALNKSPFFSALDGEQMDRFVKVAERKEFRKGDIIILEGCVDDDDDDDLKEAQKESTHLKSDDDPADPDDDILRGDTASEPRNDDDHTTTTTNLEAAPENEIRIVSHTDSEEIMDEDSSERPISANSTDTDQSDPDSSAMRRFALLTEDQKSTLAPLEHESHNTNSNPPPPRSGVKRSIYIIRRGQADVWYKSLFRPASLKAGSLFGEGGFLFGRQHSASVVVANETLECFVVDFATFQSHVLPSERMTKLFAQHATQTDDHNVPYMTMSDFATTQEHVPMFLQDSMVGIAHTYNLFQKKNKNRIYLQDFCFFHLLMARPDPEVDIAFLLMDQRRRGQVDLDDFAHFAEPIFPGLDLSSHFFQRYFGKDGKQCLRQTHASQFLVDLQREIGKQAFLRAVQEKGTVDGYLAPNEFIRVLRTTSGWSLPQGVAERLDAVYGTQRVVSDGGSRQSRQAVDGDSFAGMNYFSYGDFLAFQEVLGNLPALCNLVDRAQEVKKGPISTEDFKVANRVIGLGGRLSRRQVEIVFALFDLDRDGYISNQDTINVCGVNFGQRLVASPGGGKLSLVSSTSSPNFTNQLPEHRKDWQAQITLFLQHFFLTGVAGSIGLVVLYPLDLAKTRLMNEQVRRSTIGSYKGILDCLHQVFRFEGPAGFYRGLAPQLIGVAPEKMIKMKVNSILRQAFSSIDDHQTESRKNNRTLNLPQEVLAGAGAGASQLLFTNPMEICKIRMQIHGETSRILRERGFPVPKAQSFLSMMRGIGFPGVYRGATACLMRDVPFSAIFFPAYAICKELVVDERFSNELGARRATQMDILVSGTVAGIPAAVLTNPADVIKTRLQSLRRPDEMTYTSINDCARRIYQYEGWQTFFRGSLARTLRLVPQFSISVLCYEQLTRWCSLDHLEPRPPTSAPVNPEEYRLAFRRQNAY